MPDIDWKWFIAGILFAMFVMPFVQAQISRALGKARQPVTKNT